jgi:hypothetical protein
MKALNLCLIALICGFPASPAMAEKVLLTCVTTSTDPDHAEQTVEVAFDQESQRVWVAANGYVPAAISETRIAFDMDGGPNIRIHFTIDRTSGRLTITGNYGVLYNGQCKIADAAHRAS